MDINDKRFFQSTFLNEGIKWGSFFVVARFGNNAFCQTRIKSPTLFTLFDTNHICNPVILLEFFISFEYKCPLTDLVWEESYINEERHRYLPFCMLNLKRKQNHPDFICFIENNSELWAIFKTQMRNYVTFKCRYCWNISDCLSKSHSHIWFYILAISANQRPIYVT